MWSLTLMLFLRQLSALIFKNTQNKIKKNGLRSRGYFLFLFFSVRPWVFLCALSRPPSPSSSRPHCSCWLAPEVRGPLAGDQLRLPLISPARVTTCKHHYSLTHTHTQSLSTTETILSSSAPPTHPRLWLQGHFESIFFLFTPEFTVKQTV